MMFDISLQSDYCVKLIILRVTIFFFVVLKFPTFLANFKNTIQYC